LQQNQVSLSLTEQQVNYFCANDIDVQGKVSAERWHVSVAWNEKHFVSICLFCLEKKNRNKCIWHSFTNSNNSVLWL